MDQLCFVTTARVNDIGEEVSLKYGDRDIGMPVFIDSKSAVVNAEEIKKGIRNWEHWKNLLSMV